LRHHPLSFAHYADTSPRAANRPGFGALESLVKLQASFNPWTSLPLDLLRLPKLELFRLAAGTLPAWPESSGADGAGGASTLPSLAWCSLGGNPAAARVPSTEGVRAVDVSDLEIDRTKPLGEGASGECFRGAGASAFVQHKGRVRSESIRRS
jgi:hypothetical protein